MINLDGVFEVTISGVLRPANNSKTASGRGHVDVEPTGSAEVSSTRVMWSAEIFGCSHLHR